MGFWYILISERFLDLISFMPAWDMVHTRMMLDIMACVKARQNMFQRHQTGRKFQCDALAVHMYHMVHDFSCIVHYHGLSFFLWVLCSFLSQFPIGYFNRGGFFHVYLPQIQSLWYIQWLFCELLWFLSLSTIGDLSNLGSIGHILYVAMVAVMGLSSMPCFIFVCVGRFC